jgi:hypothetical protein
MLHQRVGVLKKVVVTLGVRFFALQMTRIVGAVNFASCQYGALLSHLKTMPRELSKKSIHAFTEKRKKAAQTTKRTLTTQATTRKRNNMTDIETMDFDFTLIYALPTDQPNAEEHLDALFEAGCDDALPGIGQPGHIALEFVREAKSASDALASAKDNVLAAIPGAKLVSVQPDIVGASEIADLADCTRQNVRKQLEKIHDLPAPLYTASGHTLWHLISLEYCLDQKTSLTIPRHVYEFSKIAMTANSEIQSSHIEAREKRKDAYGKAVTVEN